MKNVSHLINCPHCKKKNTWKPNNPFKPFCSERCKLIDLGQWADEKYKIAQDIVDEDDPSLSDDEASE